MFFNVSRVRPSVCVPFWSIAAYTDASGLDEWPAAGCAAALSTILFQQVWSWEVHLPCSLLLHVDTRGFNKQVFFPHQSCWLSNNLQLHNKLLGIYIFEKGGSWIDSDIIPQWQKNHGSFLPTDWCFRGPWEFREEISLARAACEAIKVQTVWKPKRPIKCPCCRRHRCVC